MAEKRRNGLLHALKVAAVAIAVAGGAAALITTYLVAPVKCTAERAEEKCDKNTEDIHDIELTVTEIKKDTEDIPEIKDDLKRFMREYNVPPTTDVPVGEHRSDEE